MNKFEKLIEYIINEDEAKAKALFHKIVVEKSRDIYESLVDEDQFPVQRGRGAESLGNEISNQSDVIDGDHQGMQEDDEMGDEFGAEGGDEFGGDEMGGDEFGSDEMDGDEGGIEGDEFGGDEMGGDEGGLEDRVMDLEDAIDELKAEFDSLMGDDAGEEGSDEFGSEEGSDMGDEPSDFDGEDDEAGGELGDETEAEGSKFGEASVYGESAVKTDKPWTSKDGKKQSGTAVKGDKYTGKEAAKEDKAKADKEDKAKKVKESRKSPNDLMREYIEKVGQDWGKNFPAEGDPVGSGGTKSPVNTKSVQINGKNDMGGTTANIAQGKYAADRDSNTSAKKPSNYLTKGETKMGQDKYENSPAANTKGYKDKRTVKREQEGQTTDGSVPVVKKSFNPGGTPGFKG